MSSSRLLRVGLVVVALLAPAMLAGCTSFTPVYGTSGIGTTRIALSYAKPDTRFDQIIIQDLKLKLGSTDDPEAPHLSVRTAVGSRVLTRSGVKKPFLEHEAVLTTTFVVTVNNEVIARGTRSATAGYQYSGQVLADESALRDASERAARSVAETIRLTLLGKLSTPVREAGVAQ